jgi:hypothetical protein
MKLINLTRGYSAMVDDGDYESLKDFKWQSAIRKRRDGSVCIYAKRAYAVPLNEGGYKIFTVFMHRQITGAPSGKQVDHWDGDGLNNRRINLRIATSSQQQANKTGKTNGITRFKGVRVSRSNRSWVASITVNGVYRHIGTFRKDYNAATAYNFVAYEAWGDFALMNTPQVLAPG